MFIEAKPKMKPPTLREIHSGSTFKKKKDLQIFRENKRCPWHHLEFSNETSSLHFLEVHKCIIIILIIGGKLNFPFQKFL